MNRRNILKAFLAGFVSFFFPFKAKAVQSEVLPSDLPIIEIENDGDSKYPAIGEHDSRITAFPKIKNLDQLLKNLNWTTIEADKHLAIVNNLKFYSRIEAFLPKECAVCHGCTGLLFWGKVQVTVWKYPDFLSITIDTTKESQWLRANPNYYMVPINETPRN